MSDLFLYFIFSISLFLSLNLKTLLFGVLLFLLFLYQVIRKKIRNKRFFITISLIFLFLICVYFINYFEFYETEKIYGIVVSKSDNYFILQSGFKKYYVFQKNCSCDLFDFLELNGKQIELDFDTLESAFNFNDYLQNDGVRKQITQPLVKTIINFPIDFYSIKTKLLNIFSNNEIRNFIGLLLFDYSDDTSSLSDNLRFLNLFMLFSYTGLFLNYFIYLTKKFLNLFLNDKLSSILTFLLVSPLIILNINKFSTIKVICLCLMRSINKHYFENKISRIDRISIVGLFIIFLNPFFILGQPFQISFVILIFNNYLGLFYRRMKRIKLSLTRYVILILLIIPFQISSTNSINLVGMSMSFLFMPLMKLIFIFFFVVVFILRIPFLVEWVKFFVSTISNFNYYYFNINIPSFSQILIIFYYVFLIMLFYFLEINFKKISKTILGVAITSFAIYIFPISNFFTFEVDFINVGQGDSTLIRYKNSCVMIDTGGILNYDLATNSLVPFLRKNRIYYIDSLILTHDDYDHIGAYESLKSSFYIKNVYRNKKDFPLNFENFIISNLNIYESSLDDSNYNSLVLSLSIKNKTFLFMGDAPTEIENKIVRDNHDLRCDYLKVGHHGSNTSTSKNFVSLISPKEAIISCGKDNNYGHPHKETLAILNYYNVKIRRTDLEGTIRYKFII